MLPQNRASWHIEYFKLKKCGKWHVQAGLSDLHLKQVIKLSVRDSLCTWKKGASLSPKIQGHRAKSERTGVVKSPQSTILSSYSLSYHIFPWLYYSPNLAQKHSGWTVSSGLHFLISFPCCVKLRLNKFLCFSLVNLPFATRGPSPKFRRVEAKDMFSPLQGYKRKEKSRETN